MEEASRLLRFVGAAGTGWFLGDAFTHITFSASWVSLVFMFIFLVILTLGWVLGIKELDE